MTQTIEFLETLLKFHGDKLPLSYRVAARNEINRLTRMRDETNTQSQGQHVRSMQRIIDNA